MNTKKQLCIAMVVHCIFLVIFTIGGITMIRMCTYGGLLLRIPIVILCFILTIYYISWAVAWKAGKKRLFGSKMVIVCYGVILTVIGGTCMGMSLHSLADSEGVFRTTITKMVKGYAMILTNKNVYLDGFEKLVKNIGEEVELDSTLYIKGELQVEYKRDGSLTLLKGTIYGKDHDERIRAYNLNYDTSVNDTLTIKREKNLSSNLDQNEQLTPFLQTFRAIALNKDLLDTEVSLIRLTYSGRQHLPFNAVNLNFIDKYGSTQLADMSQLTEYGNLVSCYLYRGKADIDRVDYIFIENSDSIISDDGSQFSDDSQGQSGVTEELDGYPVILEYMVDEETGYCVVTVDAALGTYYYSLYKTIDGGNNYKVINKDPFTGQGGDCQGISFIDKKIGFLCLANASGDQGSLYRTEDGGTTFNKIVIQSDKANVSFDLPGVPEIEGDSLTIRVSQGADGDYKGGIEALFTSKDKGLTWTYVKEVDPNNDEIG